MKNLYTHSIQPENNYWRLAHPYNTIIEELINLNPYDLLIGQHIIIPVSETMYQPRQSNHCINQAELDYRNDMRGLWEEHVAWTRMTIISLVFNLPNLDFVITRLLKNATDMGNMIGKLYGDVAAKTYADLIKEHLSLFADLVKAALAGDEKVAMTTEQKLFANADQIAKFLSSVNPYLPENEVREMLYHHLNLTKQEALSIINMNYQKDIEIYDEIEKQAREMADTLSNATVKLYTNAF